MTARDGRAYVAQRRAGLICRGVKRDGGLCTAATRQDLPQPLFCHRHQSQADAPVTPEPKPRMSAAARAALYRLYDLCQNYCFACQRQYLTPHGWKKHLFTRHPDGEQAAELRAAGVA